ncbi:MAG: TonB-dependent receptor, partial [Methylococcales bacterium]|nr:TonB-dependent receptor [Methylococcales bacterium]
PLQPDIYYRGFVASPLLGLPQGLSTYVNGVRFNEPFGDTVNWDLLPPGAIDTMTLSPGSNPVYGLNSLGGAIAIKTKTGFSYPKHQFEFYAGSFSRHVEELSSGWNNGTFGYFVDLRNFDENGWRDFSPTEAKQAFGTLSWRGERAEADLTLAATDNILVGNGAAPVQLLQEDKDAVFTHPDRTTNRLFFAELSGAFDVSNTIKLNGNGYFRQNQVSTFNGDDSDFEACDDDSPDAGFICAEDDDEEELVFDVNGNPIFASPGLLGATNNFSFTGARSRGGTVQATITEDLFGHGNNFIFGTSLDYAEVNFSMDTELASLTEARGTTRSDVLAGENRVRLLSETTSWGMYLTDSFDITDRLTLTLSGRFNHITVDLIDRDGDELNGSHDFDRFNPSAGITYRALDNLTWYGSYAETNRAPSPVELSCADEENPCRLPNAFIADPPLEQVVAKTFETGFRGDLNKLINRGQLNWNTTFFHTVNNNDIIFQRGGDSISEGFFDNVGETRRFGVEAGLNAFYPGLFSDIDDWHFTANYTYLRAQFLDGFRIQDPLDEDNPDGAQVRRGDFIPGIPQHVFKSTVGVDLWKRASLALDWSWRGKRFLRGDEGNDQPRLKDFWLLNLRAEVKVTDYFSVFGRVTNLLDNEYESFGVFGEADEVLGDDFDDGRFVSPGAPRAGWVGLRVSL